ncbi:MAG: hypothetical protein AAFX99_11010, partial [Myxococcota bacterium]
MKRCPNCGERNPEGLRRCRACGHSFRGAPDQEPGWKPPSRRSSKEAGRNEPQPRTSTLVGLPRIEESPDSTLSDVPSPLSFGGQGVARPPGAFRPRGSRKGGRGGGGGWDAPSTSATLMGLPSFREAAEEGEEPAPRAAIPNTTRRGRHSTASGERLRPTAPTFQRRGGPQQTRSDGSGRWATMQSRRPFVGQTEERPRVDQDEGRPARARTQFSFGPTAGGQSDEGSFGRRNPNDSSFGRRNPNDSSFGGGGGRAPGRGFGRNLGAESSKPARQTLPLRFGMSEAEDDPSASGSSPRLRRMPDPSAPGRGRSTAFSLPAVDPAQASPDAGQVRHSERSVRPDRSKTTVGTGWTDNVRGKGGARRRTETQPMPKMRSAHSGEDDASPSGLFRVPERDRSSSSGARRKLSAAHANRRTLIGMRSGGKLPAHRPHESAEANAPEASATPSARLRSLKERRDASERTAQFLRPTTGSSAHLAAITPPPEREPPMRSTHIGLPAMPEPGGSAPPKTTPPPQRPPQAQRSPDRASGNPDRAKGASCWATTLIWSLRAPLK